LQRSGFACLWQGRECLRQFRSAASIHSHTHYSRETLSFIPDFADRWPVLRRALEKKCQQSRIPVDFRAAYWTPPLSPQQALAVECGQIENELGLLSLLSLTDHDSIQAPLLLRASSSLQTLPISLEWSVPFGKTIFHLGVHNLPAAQAQAMAEVLEQFRTHATDVPLAELLAMLHAIPEALVVFNHPYWDQTRAGGKRHEAALHAFLEQHQEFLHAFELNGLRSWKENRKVAQLARTWGKPMISGGDRHGCEPSATLNLTNAQTFAEFVHEIRVEQRSFVLFMPQYQEPTFVRILQGLLDVIREYPDFPVDAQRWDDRVFHPGPLGAKCEPLSSMWSAPPALIERCFRVFGMVENITLQRVLRQTLAAKIDVSMLRADPWRVLQ
jgi:hypothetical protein